MKGKIGPHTVKEFQLFKAGKKHVIYFHWGSWPEEYLTEARSTKARVLKFRDKTFNKNSYIYYRCGYSRLARELKEIINSGMTIHDSDWESKEYRIGEILGYTKEDVSLYIQNVKNRHYAGTANP